MRTGSPSVHPRSASGGATDFFLASALLPPTGLATSRWRRRAMRPTDVCHPNELRAPAPRVFPARSRHFRSGETPWSLGLHAIRLGDRMFHDIRRPLRRIVVQRRFRTPLPHGLTNANVGVFFPRRWRDRASDTPVATSHSSSRLIHLRGCCNLAVRPSLGRFVRVGRCRDRLDHR